MEFNVQVQIPKVATRMKIDVNVVLDEKAVIRASFYEADNEYMPIYTKMIMLEGEAYRRWGADDSYIRDIVFEALGMKQESQPNEISP